jgi:hypothetical protein
MDAVTSRPPLTPDPQTACPRADPMMERRRFLGTLGLSVLAAPLAAEAQPAAKIARIGYLAGNLAAAPPPLWRRPFDKDCVTGYAGWWLRRPR